DECKVVPFYGMYSGNDAYLFWTDASTDEVWCYDVETEESWILEAEEDLTRYSISADGEYLYSCAPWGEEQILWKIVYDESGRPFSLQLIDENIQE
ncbi:MAG: hypothetical protein J6C37_11950, partial [Roseburia sp.]|nr:hypothetical protein [Roseburia sp.]